MPRLSPASGRSGGGGRGRGAPPAEASSVLDSGEPVRIRADIPQPDYVVVLDPSLLGKVNVTSGLKEGGWVIINTRKTVAEIKSEFGIKNPVATVNATRIAREVLGVPIVNTTMLGAVVKMTGVIDKKSAHAPLDKRFGRLGERNIKAMETAYAQVVSEEQ